MFYVKIKIILNIKLKEFKIIVFIIIILYYNSNYIKIINLIFMKIIGILKFLRIFI